MHVLPVLDIMNGRVVRAVGGRRAEYKPLVSTLTSATDPLGVAHAIRSRFCFDELYLADLDAIGGASPDVDVYKRLRDEGFRLWVDAGIRTRADAERIADHADVVILGSETLGESPAAIVGTGDTSRFAFSLDLRDGQRLGAFGIDDAMSAGIRRIIVIDLARVGIGQGVGTESVAARVRRQHPGTKLYLGGGVRCTDDLKRLAVHGVDGVLVASALHDGGLTP